LDLPKIFISFESSLFWIWSIPHKSSIWSRYMGIKSLWIDWKSITRSSKLGSWGFQSLCFKGYSFSPYYSWYFRYNSRFIPPQFFPPPPPNDHIKDYIWGMWKLFYLVVLPPYFLSFLSLLELCGMVSQL